MHDHRDMIVWRKLRRVVLRVIHLSRITWKPYVAAVFWQLQKAALSVQLNIAEGYAIWHPRQRRRHLRIAYGSAVETVDALELLADAAVGDSHELEGLVGEAREVCPMLVAWLKRTEEA